MVGVFQYTIYTQIMFINNYNNYKIQLFYMVSNFWKIIEGKVFLDDKFSSSYVLLIIVKILN